MANRSKLGFVEKTRKKTDKPLLDLPLPKISPNKISALSIITSLLFLLVFPYSKVGAFLLIIATLALDWFDGLIAKKYKLASEKGYVVDMTADRMSEGLILVLFPPWFVLFTLNNILSIFSFVKKKHVIIPLRHIFALYFIWVFLI